MYEVTIVFAGGAAVVLHSRTEPQWTPGRLRADWIETVAFLELGDDPGAVALFWRPVI